MQKHFLKASALIVGLAALTACSGEQKLTEQIQALPAVPEEPLDPDSDLEPALVWVTTTDFDRVDQISEADRPNTGSAEPWLTSYSEWYAEVWGPDGLGLEPPLTRPFERSELAPEAEQHDEYSKRYGVDERDADIVTNYRVLGLAGFDTTFLQGAEVADLFTDHAEADGDGIYTTPDGAVSGMELGDGVLFHEDPSGSQAAETLAAFRSSESSLADGEEGLADVAGGIDEEDWYLAAASPAYSCSGNDLPPGRTELNYYLEPYLWLGLSSDYEDDTHIHRAVLLHTDAATAETNAELVERILEEETEPNARRAYDSLELVSSELDGNLLKLTFERSVDAPRVGWVYNLQHPSYALFSHGSDAG